MRTALLGSDEHVLLIEPGVDEHVLVNPGLLARYQATGLLDELR